MKPCELFTLIPTEKSDYLFEHSDASAELDFTFLGFQYGSSPKGSRKQSPHFLIKSSQHPLALAIPRPNWILRPRPSIPNVNH